MVCYALAVAEALLLRAYLMYANRRRAGETDGTMGKEAYEDLTDWEIPGMQYRMCYVFLLACTIVGASQGAQNYTRLWGEVEVQARSGARVLDRSRSRER